ncbi:MAG: glucosidase [Vicinamibacterales bacterium]
MDEARTGRVGWYRWGPYLAERQWGTVREDYSPDGTAWEFFPHDHARARVYRWSEDGLLGISDADGLICFALALWNEADPILKERLFGLSGPEGNHGEDVKECYFFLDSTPSHSYMKALYRYPQRAFPYTDLIEENQRRGRDQPEYELIDTGVFAEERYFDVVVEYAKAGPDDIIVRITAANRGPEPAPLHLLPTLWFRNTWSWGLDGRKPVLRAVTGNPCGQRRFQVVHVSHHKLGAYWLACAGEPDLLFTNNETNAQRLWGAPNPTPFVKDGIHDAVVHGVPGAVNPERVGTKVAAHYVATIPPGEERVIHLRLSSRQHTDPFAEASDILTRRIAEADAFYARFAADDASDDEQAVQRQAFAGLLWSKQFYHYDVAAWVEGDPAGPPPPPSRHRGRNAEWTHLSCSDIISMPDTWEYPWFAAWDLAFHCVPLALVDPTFAKQQLLLLGRVWYQHPNGQLPAYEWSFGDVNPPVHAWATWRVYQIERQSTGVGDRDFLQRVFHKLMLNFTWWVNRKDAHGHNVFQGGFLGLDNIGVFDRSAELPAGGHLEQADGTAWMGMFCLNMLIMALELARDDHAYEDIATKFFAHFLAIAAALNNIGAEGISLWDDTDAFFYDVLHLPSGAAPRLKVRSLVGLIPLLAVETIEPDLLELLPDFRARMDWLLETRPEQAALVSRWNEPGMGERRLLALVRSHRMKQILKRMLDPDEFLSDHGIRSVSKFHRDHPFEIQVDGMRYTIGYEPGESQTSLFGGNSNWRGPVWLPVNYLLIEAMDRFHHYYGDAFTVECPSGSGTMRTLQQVAAELSQRVTALFTRGDGGQRPIYAGLDMVQANPDWSAYILFHEYFHGESGAGLGASHQTGWTALVAALIGAGRRHPS